MYLQRQNCLLVHVLTTLIVLWTVNEVWSAAPPISVLLKSFKKDYVLGEPVELTLLVKNDSDRTINVWVDLLKWNQATIEIVRDGGDFKEFTLGTQAVYEIVPSTTPLQPNQERQYTFRILYTYYFGERQENRNRLAFEKPGTYMIRARYLAFPEKFFPEGVGREELTFETNTIEITVTDREGNDVRTWQRLDNPEILYFLQRDELLIGSTDVPFQLAELLKTIPDSSYHDDVRGALARFYQGNWSRLTENEAELFRSVTGIKLPPPQPFPDDRRLDQIITYRLSQERTPLEEVYKIISAQSGVELRIHPDLRVRAFVGKGRVTRPLRDFMRSQAAHKAKWIKDGDGYKLVPDEPEAEAE